MKRHMYSEHQTSRVQIPAEFKEYYTVVSDEELEDLIGSDSRPYPCEEIEGYECNHIAWLSAKNKYIDSLSNNALDIVELIDEAGNIFVGQCIGNRICPVGIDEVKKCCNN